MRACDTWTHSKAYGRSCVYVCAAQPGRSSVSAQRCPSEGGGRWVNCQVIVRVIWCKLPANEAPLSVAGLSMGAQTMM